MNAYGFKNIENFVKLSCGSKPNNDLNFEYSTAIRELEECLQTGNKSSNNSLENLCCTVNSGNKICLPVKNKLTNTSLMIHTLVHTDFQYTCSSNLFSFDTYV